MKKLLSFLVFCFLSVSMTSCNSNNDMITKEYLLFSLKSKQFIDIHCFNYSGWRKKFDVVFFSVDNSGMDYVNKMMRVRADYIDGVISIQGFHYVDFKNRSQTMYDRNKTIILDKSYKEDFEGNRITEIIRSKKNYYSESFYTAPFLGETSFKYLTNSGKNIYFANNIKNLKGHSLTLDLIAGIQAKILITSNRITEKYQDRLGNYAIRILEKTTDNIDYMDLKYFENYVKKLPNQYRIEIQGF